MFTIIKNSLKITWKNQVISLFLVLYLIIISLILPKFSFMSPVLIIFTSALMLIFTSAFFSGWYGMIKTAVEDFYIPNLSEEEKIKNAYSLKDKFFGYTTKYILPVLICIIIYYVLFFILIKLTVIFADKFIGSLDFIINDTKTLAMTNDAFIGYIKSLPQDKLLMIFYWQILMLTITTIFSALTIFWPSALYFNNTKNPLIAYKNSFLAIFRKPLSVICFNLLIGICFFIFTQLASLTVINTIISFVYMVFGIYFFVFLTVLIFNYYGKTFENIGDSGADSIGQDENSN